MTTNEIISLIKQRKADWEDRALLAGPGTTDVETLEAAQRAAMIAQELDEILAVIEMAGVLTGSEQPDANMRPHVHTPAR